MSMLWRDILMCGKCGSDNKWTITNPAVEDGVILLTCECGGRGKISSPGLLESGDCVWSSERGEQSDDVLLFNRAIELIENIVQGEQTEKTDRDAEDLICALDTYFKRPTDIFDTDWANRVLRELRNEFFEPEEASVGMPAVEFLDRLCVWLKGRMEECQ